MLRMRGPAVSSTAPGPQTLLAWLAGTWSLEREVHGGDSRVTAIRGIASFTPDGESAAEYVEQVSIVLPDGEVLNGSQHYRYEQTAEGLAVYFRPDKDGVRALFHELKFEEAGADSLSARASHLCADDVYDTTYQVSAGQSFSVRHAVLGPRKEYVIQTRFQRKP